MRPGNAPTAREPRSFEPGIGKVEPWAQSGPSNTSYYHANQIGTTRFMTDSGGQQVAPAVYTAFGERVSGTMTGASDRYGYAGAWGYGTHEDFPFLHVGARYYDPSTGRFLQRDPLGIRAGLNVYAYVRSRPTLGLDPSGLGWWNRFKDWVRRAWGGGKGKGAWATLITVCLELIDREVVPRLDDWIDDWYEEESEKINRPPRLPPAPPELPYPPPEVPCGPKW